MTGHVLAGSFKVSMAIQNCNSLNLTCADNVRDKKIASILDLDTDIILLSDTRMSNKKMIFSDLIKLRYRLYDNSTMSKRGVAILIRNNLDFNVIDTFRDDEQNILLIKAKVKGYIFTIGALYGPNNDTDNFFPNLTRGLRLIGCNRIILGGDWNLTPSSAVPVENPDTYRMAGIPSGRRTALFDQVCNDFSLVDIFRILYGDKADFTYVPFGNKHNRSRIDFFAMSDDLIPFIDRCGSSSVYCKKFFDHKPVLLHIGKERKATTPTLNNRILGHPLLFLVSLLATYECYILYTIQNQFGPREAEIQNLCCCLDELDWREKSLQRYCSAWSWRPDLDEHELEARDRLLMEVDRIRNELMPLEDLAGFRRSIDDDFFFEALADCTKKAALDLQGRCAGQERLEKKILAKEINLLNKNFDLNSERIVFLENRLSSLVEKEIEDKVSNFVKDDILNFEKMTPRFLNIARASKTDSLSQILSDTGTPFVDIQERSDFITNFYTNLYKVPEELRKVNFNGCVKNFLGEEICNNPYVKGMRITDGDRERLDSPYTAEELDAALEDSNMKSAPGIDGINNKFIKFIWKLVRMPLLRYVRCCFNKGRLTDNFRTACIKLIPKKGDLSKIKNWRPISLLSCYYKIVSRVINHRLGTVIDTITGRGQKAYNNKRYIHEVIINLNNTINACIRGGKPGVIISIDQQKAFDSIMHEFCRDAYRFFGFGENFIEMMSVLGDNRCAKIQLEDGTLSESFPLERGRAQGDSPSPRQYNIGEQVFLIKIEFDTEIPKLNTVLPLEHPLPEWYYGKKIDTAILQGAGTEKTESFADDANIATVQCFEAVQRIKSLMESFYLISGLKCNIEKTSIMYIGPDNVAEQEKIRQLGFNVVTEIKCLGFVLDRSGLGLERNYDLAYDKIVALARYWKSFGLSIFGRATVSKTFLISQLTYLGAILQPTEEQIIRIQSQIDNFVLGGIPWSKKTLYDPPADSGLGLINVNNFITALRCSWFKRIFTEGVNDNWRLNLFKNCFFNPISFRPDQLEMARPLEYNIGMAFWDFLMKFWSTKNNIMHAPLIKNPCFSRGLADTGRLDARLLDPAVVGLQNYRNNEEKWLSLRCSDFFIDQRLKSYVEVQNTTNVEITPVAFLAIRKSIIFALKKYRYDLTKSKGISLEFVLLSKNKKSKVFRRWLTAETPGVAYKGKNLIRKLCELVGLPVPGIEIIRGNLGCWSYHFLPVQLKDFALKLVRNSLPVNARLAGRYGDAMAVSESCRLCVKKIATGPIPRETFAHFFIECEVTESLSRQFRTKYFSDWTEREFTSWLFLGTNVEGEFCMVNRILALVFLHEIWKSRLRKNSNPCISTVEINMKHELGKMFQASKKLENEFANCDLLLCREWWRADRRGRG
jgi:hypothetical protein